MYFSTLLSAAATINLARAGYVLQDDYMQDFFGNFDFFTAADPTNGFVSFVDQATAQSTGLINSTSGVVSWGVDTTNTTPNGRPSVRISSKKTYDSGLVVVDVAHMPTGCGTWPAFWMVGPSWPSNGEIDIIEGVNEQDSNAMTLHTGPNCAISSNTGDFSGSVSTSNCDVNAADQDKNAGCSIQSKDTQSYGTGLNAISGGVYATQWTDSAIAVYFFPRGSIPSDITSGSPDPTGWGTPAALFQGACDIGTTFKQQQIVFDTTFCGDWAGQVWSSGSCASKAATCNDFVQNNPSAFTDAYWTINSLKVYQDNGDATPSRVSSASSASSVISSAIATSEVPTPTSEIPIPTSVIVPPVNISSLSVVSSITIPSSLFFPTIASSSVVIPPLSTGTGGRASHSHHHRQSQSAGAVAGSTAAAVIVPTSAVVLIPKDSSIPSSGVLAKNATTAASTAIPSPTTAPTGSGGNANSGPMKGFQWPKEHEGGQGNGTASSLSAPAASSVAIPSTTLLVATSAAVVPSSVTTAATIPTSEVVDRVVQTVYETDYVTVAGRAAETPAPVGNHERHVRQHRRRLTQHNAARR